MPHLLCLLTASAAYQPPLTLHRHGTGPAPRAAVSLLGGGGVPDDVRGMISLGTTRGTFKPYSDSDLGALWKGLVGVYGSADLAKQAVRQNPTIMSPAFQEPSIFGRSKKALVSVMGEEEALEVMLKNPAVLQCGSSLAQQSADEIKSFANIRQLLDSVPREASLVILVALALLVLTNVVLTSSGASPELLETTKPIAGGAGALVFAVAGAFAAKSSMKKN